MDFEITDLNDEQAEDIEQRLAKYDDEHSPFKLSDGVSIGAVHNGKLIGGADGCMTAYRIFYVSTVYVDEAFRGKGIGKRLMQSMEARAKALGANMIRLDTFDWQGVRFYEKLEYEQVGMYENKTDGFSEYFFLKRI